MNKGQQPLMQIVNFQPEFAEQIANVFYQAVHAIDDAIYSERQKCAWAPYPIDYPMWYKRLAKKQPFVALIDEQVAGFIELESDGHIDCTYVLPKFQGQGVAVALLKHVIAVAKQMQLTQLYVEASIVAKPVFERFGFVVEKENLVIRNNVELTNYRMRLHFCE